MEKLKILIADDHELVRSGIKYTLKRACEKGRIGRITQAPDGATTLRKAMTGNYDIILLDVRLPDISGVEVASTLLKREPGTKIVALTMHDGEFEIRSMLRAGVVGYLLKTTTPEMLSDAIESVMGGGKYFSPEVAEILEKPQPRGFWNKSKLLSVTIKRLGRRERMILKMICDGLTNETISATLGLSSRTISTHRTSLITKFGVRNTASLVKSAVKLGVV